MTERRTRSLSSPAGGRATPHDARPPKHEPGHEQHGRQQAEREPEEPNPEPAETAEMQLDQLDQHPFAGPVKIVEVVVEIVDHALERGGETRSRSP